MMAGTVFRWLDELTGLGEWRRKKRDQAVPAHLGFLRCFGGVSLLIILLQVGTGITMLFYYRPQPLEALKSIEQFSNETAFGGLFRNMHRWGSTLLLATVFSHMVSVGFQKAYRNPRELNWVSGVLQLIVVFLLLATGLTLPWDWRSYWSFALWVDYLDTWPLIGGYLKDALLDNFTINRSFVVHILVLPLLLAVLLRFHFRMVRRHGIAEPL